MLLGIGATGWPVRAFCGATCTDSVHLAPQNGHSPRIRHDARRRPPSRAQTDWRTNPINPTLPIGARSDTNSEALGHGDQTRGHAGPLVEVLQVAVTRQ